ncbi:hypothetical protein K402DRAFT_387105 [Aulographum hederae CBS 113979]|uniref:Uncharacterized protein n=1 Tax=Aulographum hederae CBS 113979 TaxID=1176131 RepID=A0A6G1GJR7_9PEZI|nr:hypothetical protein K402DRAFT_387105 [Aulographum hederae CBS 113979]
MFNFGSKSTPVQKCYFTHLKLPSDIDEKKPPTRTKPFSTILGQPFSHSATMILPKELYEIVRAALERETGLPRYERVFMSLQQVLEGDFFNQYIKTGNILMLSEGRPGVDNRFELKDGILRIEVDRATYERCGLQGKPISDGGRKHVKTRFAIDLNLRLPSMLHGKKGFDRLKYASKTVLNQSLTWLFVDLSAPSTLSSQDPPIKSFQPKQIVVRPVVTPLPNANVPALAKQGSTYDATMAEELLEFISLLELDSPRIKVGDEVDPYLSRYEVPRLFETTESEDAAREEGDPKGNRKSKETQKLVCLKWKGFLTLEWILATWMLVRRASRKKMCISITANRFGGGFYTILELGDDEGEVLCWECGA